MLSILLILMAIAGVLLALIGLVLIVLAKMSNEEVSKAAIWTFVAGLFFAALGVIRVVVLNSTFQG